MAIYSTDKVGWSRTLRAAYRYAANNDYASAIKFYNEALKEGRNKGLIYNNLADAYLQAGQLDRATACAGEASGRRGDSVPHVTLGQIYQAKGEHKKAVDCMIKARNIFEESMPGLKNMTFDSIEEVIKKLSARAKFDIASKDWIRLVYLVKLLRSNYEKEREYIERGATWELLLEIREKTLNSIGQKYQWTKEKLGIKGSDAIAIANTYGAVCAITGSPRVDVVGENKNSSSIRISACWQFSVIKGMELDKDPGWVECSRMCGKNINSVARSINPEANFVFCSTLADGGSYCMGKFIIDN